MTYCDSLWPAVWLAQCKRRENIAHTLSRDHGNGLNHAVNCPQVFAKWVRVSRVWLQGESFVLFSGIVPQRNHVASDTQRRENI